MTGVNMPSSESRRKGDPISAEPLVEIFNGPAEFEGAGVAALEFELRRNRLNGLVGGWWHELVLSRRRLGSTIQPQRRVTLIALMALRDIDARRSILPRALAELSAVLYGGLARKVSNRC